MTESCTLRLRTLGDNKCYLMKWLPTYNSIQILHSKADHALERIALKPEDAENV